MLFAVLVVKTTSGWLPRGQRTWSDRNSLVTRKFWPKTLNPGSKFRSGVHWTRYCYQTGPPEVNRSTVDGYVCDVFGDLALDSTFDLNVPIDECDVPHSKPDTFESIPVVWLWPRPMTLTLDRWPRLSWRHIRAPMATAIREVALGSACWRQLSIVGLRSEAM